MEYRKIMGNIHGNGNAGRRRSLRPRLDRPGRRQQRQSDRELPARRGRQRERDVPRRRLAVSAPERVDFLTPATRGRSTTSSRSTTACAGTTTRRRQRRTTVSRSSIRSGANPGAGGRPGRLAFAGDGYGAAQLRRPLSREGMVRRVRAAARGGLQAQRQDGAPQRLGHLLHAGVLPRLGRRHLAGRLLDHAHVQHHARRHPAGVLAGAGASRRTSSGRRLSVGLQERPGIRCIARSTPTSVRTRISGTSRSTASWDAISR